MAESVRFWVCGIQSYMSVSFDLKIKFCLRLLIRTMLALIRKLLA